jgi:hypothetical protein
MRSDPIARLGFGQHEALTAGNFVENFSRSPLNFERRTPEFNRQTPNGEHLTSSLLCRYKHQRSKSPK